MSSLNRRVLLVAVGGLVLGVCPSARASLRKVEESEPKAVAVGYRHDTTRVDPARYPKHRPIQNCANCLAYLAAKPSDEWGECDLMSDRLVHRDGWCSSYKPIKPARKG